MLYTTVKWSGGLCACCFYL